MRLLEARSGHEQTRHLNALVAITGGLTRAVMGAAILHLHAMGLRRVPLAQMTLGQAVVREQQLIEGLAQPRLRGFDQGVDVRRVVVERLQDVVLHAWGQASELFLDFHDDGLVGGHRVMRVLWHHEQIVDPRSHDLCDGFSTGRGAIAHAHDDGQASCLFELSAELVSRDDQGRTFRGPNARVSGGTLLRTGPEDDAFQKDPA